jgi:hypothetical protein
MFSFSTGNYFLHLKSDNPIAFGHAFKVIFLQTFGDYNHNGFTDFQWLFFYCSIFYIALVLMNLLIAIISDTYDRVTMTAQKNE